MLPAQPVPPAVASWPLARRLGVLVRMPGLLARAARALECQRAVLVAALATVLGCAATARAQTADVPGAPTEAHPHAEIEPDAALSLQEVVAHTAEHEPGWGVVEARRFESAALRRDGARLLAGAPAVIVDHVNDALWTDVGYRQWDALLELPLWWPGQRSGRQRVARAAEEASEHAKLAHLLEVAGWVRAAVAELSLTDVRLELAESEWRAEETLVAKVRRAVELGELSERDLLLATTASRDRRFRYLEALEESRHAESEYTLLTGLSRWPSSWEEEPADRSAFEDHPLRLLAARETERAEAAARHLGVDQWGNPVIAIGTQHEREVSGDAYDDRVVAGLRIPLGRRSDAASRVASARRTVSQVRRDAGRLERALRERLARAEHRLALAADRVATAREQASAAAEYLRLTDRGFALGETDLETVLRARARAMAAEQTHREALLIRRAGVAELNQALGVTP